MKKTLTTLLLIVALVLLCVACVACDTTPENPDDNGGHNQYEQAKYTVTFNVNSSDFKLTNNVVRNVVSGTSVEEPKNADGSKVKPIKTGYTFLYWSADGTTEFVFGTTPITKNTTITAIYKNNEYELEAVVDEKLKIEKDEKGNYVYSLEKDATIGASVNADSKYVVTYDKKTDKLDNPTPKDGDTFLFWFYIGDSGKPVQLTEEAVASEAATTLKSEWTIPKSVKIYAMFKSTLPKVTVEYIDSRNDSTISTEEYPVSETISKDKSDSISASIATGEDYKFSKWYYVKTFTEDGEEKSEKVDFVADDSKNATSLRTACGISDYFTPASLKLYAKFTKQIAIGNVGDYQQKLYNVLHGSDVDEKKIEELLDANVKIVSDIDFSGYQFKPLFDADHVFAGTIDGGIYNGESQLSGKHKLSNGSFGTTSHASVFGYVSGTIENLDFENVKLIVEKTDGKYDNIVYMGYIASVLGGRVENCDVTVTTKLTVGEDSSDDATWAETGMKAVYFGAIAARVDGDSSLKDSGVIRKCDVVLDVDFACESLTFGGVCATGNSASVLEQNTVNVTIEKAHCHDDSQTSNGKSFARIGGIVASNGGEIKKCEATVKVESFTSLEEAYFGGVCADNAGSIQTTSVNATLNANVGGAISQIVCIGGMVGRNEGYILNSYCTIDLNVSAQKANGIVAVGGIVGSNAQTKSESSTSATTGSGAINMAYAVGNIKIATTVDKNSTVTLYAGGMVGRNAQTKKIANCFVVVGIDVKNETKGANYLGQMFGKHEQKTEFSVNSLHYASDDSLGLKLNGEKFEITDENTKDVQGNSQTEATFKQEGTFTGLGKLLDFNTGEEGVWKMTNGAYPTLK